MSAFCNFKFEPARLRPNVTRCVQLSYIAFFCCPALFSLQINSAYAAEWEYSVHRGDTLIGLAQRYFVDPGKWLDLQKLNGVRNPRKLQPQSILRIPIEWLREVPTTASVSILQGHATIKRGDEDKSLAIGDMLQPGDIVKTAVDASLVLHFIDGSKLLLLKDSELKLSRLGNYPKTGMAATELDLTKGRTESKVQPLKGAASRYEIRTPMAQLGVRGTDFRVAVDQASNSSFSEVLEGGVKATASDTSIDVKKGFGTRVVLGEAPSAPVELLPPPDLSNIAPLIDRTPIRFRWAPSVAASGYRVQIEREKQSDAILNDALFKSTEASFPDLPDGKYAMRVRAVDANGLEGYNAAREFVVKARPEPPFLQSPEDKITVRGDRPQFKWAKISEAARYRFQLASDEKISEKLIDESGWKTNDLDVAKPLAPGEYFWRVASIRASGDQGPFGDVQQFTLKAIPKVEAGSAQPKIDDSTLTLQWKGGPPGQTYQVQLARNREFSPLLKEENLTQPKIELQRPVGGIIFMRVKAIDSDGYEGPYGPPQEIQVAPNYPIVKLKADSEKAKFAWPAGLTGQKMQLQFARNARFEPTLLDTTTDATEAEIQRPAGSEFFVRTRRFDSDGYAEEFSKSERVALNEPSVQIDTPKLEKGNIMFNWPAPLPGQQFRFQLAHDKSFRAIVHEATLQENQLQLKSPAAGRYFVRVGLIDHDGFVAPFGPTQQFDVPRNYWPLLLLLPLLLL